MSLEDQDRASEDGHLNATTHTNTEANELIKAVDEMLENVTTKFTKVSTEVFAKLDEMGQRIDELEAAIKAGADNNTAEGEA